MSSEPSRVDATDEPEGLATMITPPLLWAEAIWASMFHLGPSVLEKALRPVLVYLFLVGKRELAQLNPFDLIVLLSLSNTLQNAMIGEDNTVSGGLIGAFSLCAINDLVVRFLFKHRRLDQWIGGKPSVLIEDGKVRGEALSRELLSLSELETIVHRQGFASLDEVRSCVLLTGGTFAVEGFDPPRSTVRHGEILGRMDELARQIDELNRLLRPAR